MIIRNACACQASTLSPVGTRTPNGYSDPEMARKTTKNNTTRPKRSSSTTARGHERTRADHARELAEDYVELIDDLITEKKEARAVDIAKHLGVSHVTVTNTVARLKRDGLVTSEPYRSIFLTSKGRKLAEHARSRHTLVLDFLIALGVPGKDADTDAEGIEHHLSPSTLTAMQKFLESRETI